MEWCAQCKERNSCIELCEGVENMLRIPKPWKAREGSLTVVHQNTRSSEQSELDRYFSPLKIRLRRKMISAAEEILTPTQLDIFHLLLKGKQTSEIADELSKNRSTIHTAIYGSSNGRGGIVRKLQKNCS